ncbi:MAG: M15 family metallopeptidase [Candidatus Saccharimonadales bacterium]
MSRFRITNSPDDKVAMIQIDECRLQAFVFLVEDASVTACCGQRQPQPNWWRMEKQSEQIRLREQHGCGGANVYNSACKGRPPTAVPGRSNHEKGLAMNFRNCSSRSTACHQWLAQNAARFGLFNLPSEPWHWSVKRKIE